MRGGGGGKEGREEGADDYGDDAAADDDARARGPQTRATERESLSDDGINTPLFANRVELISGVRARGDNNHSQPLLYIPSEMKPAWTRK